MVTSTAFSIDYPRVSSNQLGEYTFSSEAKRARMLRDMKYGNSHRAPYYQSALHGILGSLSEGSFGIDSLKTTEAKIRASEIRGPNHAIKVRNNAEMIRRFAGLSEFVSLHPGDHKLIWRNATMEMNGVVISVRPEIITHYPSAGLMAFTKFRFSKSAISADASEIVLLLLLHYAQQAVFDGSDLDLEHTMLIDCYAQMVIRGHQLSRVRQTQLDDALADIRWRWPRIQANDQPSAPH